MFVTISKHRKSGRLDVSMGIYPKRSPVLYQEILDSSEWSLSFETPSEFFSIPPAVREEAALARQQGDENRSIDLLFSIPCNVDLVNPWLQTLGLELYNELTPGFVGMDHAKLSCRSIN